MIKKKFRVISKLGVGTYSKVYKVQRASDGKFYAMKMVKMPKLSKKGTPHIMTTFNHIFLRKSKRIE